MRKSLTIVLLFLFLFNLIGYYGVYLGLRFQTDRALKQKLDTESYSNQETLTVKLPFLLPYQMEGKGYERIDGQFEQSGEFYHLVKHKLVNDTLYIVYIKDHQSTSLFKSLVDFVQTSGDMPVSKSALKFIENLVKDYVPASSSLQIASLGWCQDTIFNETHQLLVSKESTVFSPPPDFL